MLIPIVQKLENTCFRKKKVLGLILPQKDTIYFQDFFSMYIFHIIVITSHIANVVSYFSPLAL